MSKSVSNSLNDLYTIHSFPIIKSKSMGNNHSLFESRERPPPLEYFLMAFLMAFLIRFNKLCTYSLFQEILKPREGKDSGPPVALLFKRLLDNPRLLR